jgi:hypothetical protein
MYMGIVNCSEQVEWDNSNDETRWLYTVVTNFRLGGEIYVDKR